MRFLLRLCDYGKFKMNCARRIIRHLLTIPHPSVRLILQQWELTFSKFDSLRLLTRKGTQMINSDLIQSLNFKLWSLIDLTLE